MEETPIILTCRHSAPVLVGCSHNLAFKSSFDVCGCPNNYCKLLIPRTACVVIVYLFQHSKQRRAWKINWTTTPPYPEVGHWLQDIHNIRILKLKFNSMGIKVTKCSRRCSTLRLFGVLILEWLLAVQRLGKRKLYTVLYINRRLLPSSFHIYSLHVILLTSATPPSSSSPSGKPTSFYSPHPGFYAFPSLHRSLTNTSWFLFANMLQAIHMLRICTRTCHPSAAAPYSTDIQCITIP